MWLNGLLKGFLKCNAKPLHSEFYRGTAILASFFSKLEQISEEKGSSIDEKLDDLAPRVHDFLLNDPLSVPPEIDLEPVPEWDTEDELFRDS